MTSIEYHAFSGCSSLTSVTIGNSVTSIGNGAFYNCSGLKEINVASNNEYYKSVDGNLYSKDEKTLIQYAIGKTTTEFIIPGSVTSIGDCAFAGCSGLTSITIPNSVTSIGSSAFASCTSLTSITIPVRVTSIGDCAFYNCDCLTSITIPVRVSSIGEWAFFGCDNLTNVIFDNPNGWKAGSNSISSSNLSNNTSTAATYLKSTYCDYTWTRT